MKPYIVTYKVSQPFSSTLELVRRCSSMHEACCYVRDLHTLGVKTATITDKEGNVVVSNKDNILWSFASSPAQTV